MTETGHSRRGRPPKGTSQERRARVLAAAREEIVEHGYERATMLGIARRCGASKETLYSWFGSKQALFGEIVAAEGRATIATLERALLRHPDDPRRALGAFARALLDLLCGPWSVAANRAAMGSPELAQLVLSGGRHGVGPLVEGVISGFHDDGLLDAPGAAAAFRQLYGLVVQDTQTRVLLGEAPPSAAARRRQADEAVTAFLRLHPPRS